MIAGEDLRVLLPPRLRVFLLDNLSIILDDIGEAAWSENPPPEVVGLDTVRVRRVASAVVPPLIERQEPGGFTQALPCPSSTVWPWNRPARVSCSGRSSPAQSPPAGRGRSRRPAGVLQPRRREIPPVYPPSRVAACPPAGLCQALPSHRSGKAGLSKVVLKLELSSILRSGPL